MNTYYKNKRYHRELTQDETTAMDKYGNLIIIKKTSAYDKYKPKCKQYTKEEIAALNNVAIDRNGNQVYKSS